MLTCSHVNFWKKEGDSLQQPWSNGATKTFYIKSVNISVPVNPQWTNLLTVTLGSRKQTFHQFLLSFLVCQGLTRQIRFITNTNTIQVSTGFKPSSLWPPTGVSCSWNNWLLIVNQLIHSYIYFKNLGSLKVFLEHVCLIFFI